MPKTRFLFRQLNIKTDYDKGFMHVLSQLTDGCDITKKQFMDISQNISKQKYILVVEDMKTNKIIGTGTLLFELKYTGNGSYHAHIEDVVVDQRYREMGIGYKIVRKLVDIGKAVNKEKSMNVKRFVLDCQRHNVMFYKKCGFFIRGIEMTLYFDDKYNCDKSLSLGKL